MPPLEVAFYYPIPLMLSSLLGLCYNGNTKGGKKLARTVKTAKVVNSAKKSRNYVIDLIRFICAIGIVIHHCAFLYYIDPNEIPDNSRFRIGIILVEIFLIVSGYFTAKHFKTNRILKLETRFKDSIKYTLKKFKVFIPYIIISVLLGLAVSLIINGLTRQHLIEEISKLPEELTLSSVFYNTFVIPAHNPALWYLSATFLAFPLFCVLSASHKKFTRDWIYLIAILVYYTTFWTGSFTSWDALIRVFIGLAFGQLLFDLVEYFKTIKLKKSQKVYLTVIELSCALLIFAQIASRGDALRPVINNPTIFNILLAAFVQLLLVLSEQTYSTKINFKFFSFLGKFSLPIYLLHYPVLILVGHMLSNLDYKPKVVIAIISSLVCSAIIFLIVDYISRKKSKQ